MKIKVTLETELVVEFDENSKDFKELFECYKKAICDSTHEEFAENVCNMIARYGVDEFIEGVGNVRVNGEKQKDYFAKGGVKEIDNPVNVIGEFDLNDKCDFEISDTQILDE